MLLQVESLTKLFGGLVAVHDLKFGIGRDQIIGLIGPNGAGKSVTFDLISGFTKTSRGKIHFDGENIGNLKPYEIARRGLVRTWQEIKVLKNRSVLENLSAAAYLSRRSGVTEREIRMQARELLRVSGLSSVKDVGTSELAHGARRLVQICVAASARPRLLLLDEPTAGMSHDEAATVIHLARELRHRGTTVLVIEHNMKVIMSICDEIIVMSAGEKIAEGSPKAIAGNPKVIDVYLGT